MDVKLLTFSHENILLENLFSVVSYNIITDILQMCTVSSRAINVIDRIDMYMPGQNRYVIYARDSKELINGGDCHDAALCI